MAASDSITVSPWTSKEVETLNEYQSSGVWHPFTCFTKEKHADPDAASVLLATEDGWLCPHCDFHQGWAWQWQMDKSRWPVNLADGGL